MDDETRAVRTLTRLARLLERGCPELSLPQYRLLAMVAGGDERATRLAERLAVTKPTVTAVVDALVERGLLCRSAVPGDRRAARIVITPAGRRALRAADAALAHHLEPVLARVPDRPRVLAALGRLGDALDDLAGTWPAASTQAGPPAAEQVRRDPPVATPR